jgi:hypothetical protein
MGARISSATERALKLVAGGMPVYKAAVQAGIYPTTLYAALERIGKHKRTKRSKGGEQG